MSIINDNNCGWINNLPKRSNIKKLNSNLLCDYLIVGAGYTGLSAARQLANNLKYPSKSASTIIVFSLKQKWIEEYLQNLPGQ